MSRKWGVLWSHLTILVLCSRWSHLLPGEVTEGGTCTKIDFHLVWVIAGLSIRKGDHFFTWISAYRPQYGPRSDHSDGGYSINYILCQYSHRIEQLHRFCTPPLPKWLATFSLVSLVIWLYRPRTRMHSHTHPLSHACTHMHTTASSYTCAGFLAAAINVHDLYLNRVVRKWACGYMQTAKLHASLHIRAV